MEIKPKYIFQANSYNRVQHEFSTKQDLYKFIHSFNFRCLYDSDGNAIPGLMTHGFNDNQFKIGARIVFEIDGYEIKSSIIWGPKYYVGRSAWVSNNVFHVEMPVVKSRILYGNARYSEFIRIYKNGDMVFDPVRMRQVYPPCNGHLSELTRFTQQIEKQKYNLEKGK